MAPELFNGVYSTSSDVYAFAVMLNEMLTEELPFAGAAMAAVMHNVVTYRRRPTAFTADVSNPVGCQLMSLINMGWNQDPQLRVSFADLAKELGVLLHQTAETSKHGTAAAAVSGGSVVTPPRPSAADVESSIAALSQWFQSACQVGSSDSLPLAHALVTVKCIASAAALEQALLRTPDLLARELKVSAVHEQQIKAALGSLKCRLRLENLNGEQVGQLLDHCMMSSSKNLFQEQELTGLVLNSSVESWSDLTDLGMKTMPAKALFKLISEWKADGLPADFAPDCSSTPAPPSKSQEPAAAASTSNNTTATEVSRRATMDKDNELTRLVRSPAATAAAQRLKVIADTGDHLGEAYVFNMYQYGCSRFQKDAAQALLYAKKALPWLQAEADKGCKYSQFCIGAYFEYGIAAPKDEPLSLIYYKLAADQGHAFAQCSLGWSYQQGIGAGKNPAEAFKYFKLAADQGHSAAQHELGRCYDEGTGVAKNAQEASWYFQQAVDQGYSSALLLLARKYYNGTGGVSMNKEEAAKYFQRAADQGVAVAQHDVAHCYLTGTGVAKNQSEAAKYYRLAADQGRSDSQRELGYMYFYGTGVTKNQEEAVRLYKLAADQGLAIAQYDLGYSYYNGLGAPQNKLEGVKLFKLAADQGIANAQYQMGFCHRYASGARMDTAEAVRYYKLAADQGHAEAQCELAYCYANGVSGVKENNQEALRYYQMALKQGYKSYHMNEVATHLQKVRTSAPAPPPSSTAAARRATAPPAQKKGCVMC